MILTEFLNNETLIKHYSDKGVMLLQVETGLLYSDPVDVVPCRYTYEETDVMIETAEVEEDPNEATVEDYHAALSEFGVVV